MKAIKVIHFRPAPADEDAPGLTKNEIANAIGAKPNFITGLIRTGHIKARADGKFRPGDITRALKDILEEIKSDATANGASGADQTERAERLSAAAKLDRIKADQLLEKLIPVDEAELAMAETFGAIRTDISALPKILMDALGAGLGKAKRNSLKKILETSIREALTNAAAKVEEKAEPKAKPKPKPKKPRGKKRGKN